MILKLERRVKDTENQHASNWEHFWTQSGFQLGVERNQFWFLLFGHFNLIKNIKQTASLLNFIYISYLNLFNGHF